MKNVSNHLVDILQSNSDYLNKKYFCFILFCSILQIIIPVMWTVVYSQPRLKLNYRYGQVYLLCSFLLHPNVIH